ncbi:MAG: hypothetical protein NT072_01665 [Deltaproteobacteria bacterium]|nr:hypothetical protein [Deltaproteobacteria bacterium]
MTKRTLKIGFLLLCVGIFALALTSCGESTEDTGTIELTADKTAIPADGVSSAAITATLKNESGTPVIQGTEVYFTTDLGRFSNGSMGYTLSTADATGVVTISLIAGTVAGDAHVVAKSNGVKQTIAIRLVSPSEVGTTASIELSSNKTSLPADGSSSAAITATLTDATGSAVAPGTKVVFTTDHGTFTGGTTTYTVSITDDSGKVTVALIAGTTSGVAQVVATSNGVTQNILITFAGEGGAGSVSSIALAADPTSIPADGGSSTKITAMMLGGTGTAVAKGTSVTFTTTLGTFANGLATYQVATEDDTGTVVVSLIAGLVQGSAAVTAESSGVKQKILITLTGAGGTSSITLVADPLSIPADGTSSSDINTKLYYATNVPVGSGTVVSFSTTLGTFPNGKTTYQAATDSFSEVNLSLTSGKVPGTATVTVDALGVTQTILIIFTPTGGTTASIGLEAKPLSIPADGSSSTAITATLLDGIGAAVGIGTYVTFTTDLGTFSNGTATFTVATSDDTSKVTVSLIAGTVTGVAHVVATSNSVEQAIIIKLVEPGQVGETASITLATEPLAIPADGSSSAAITATLKDVGGNNVVVGTEVVFTTDLGTFSGVTTFAVSTSDDLGKVTVSLIAGATSGVAHVLAASNGVTQTILIMIAQPGQIGDTASIVLASDKPAIPADGASSVAITATLTDTAGNPVYQGTDVIFTIPTTDPGTFPGGVKTYSVSTIDDSGKVTVALIAGTVKGVSHVNVTSNVVTQSIKTPFYTPGKRITVLADPGTLPADGSSTSTIIVVTIDALGDIDELDYPVTFTITSGTGSFADGTGSGVGATYVGYKINGIAEATYIASTTAGSVVIQASYVGTPGTIAGTTTLTLTP